MGDIKGIGKNILLVISIPASVLSIIYGYKSIFELAKDTELFVTIGSISACLLVSIIFLGLINFKLDKTHLEKEKIKVEKDKKDDEILELEKTVQISWNYYQLALENLTRITKRTKKDLKKLFDLKGLPENENVNETYRTVLADLCENIKSYVSDVIEEDCSVTIYTTFPFSNDNHNNRNSDDIAYSHKVKWLVSDEESRSRYQGNNKKMKREFLANEDSIFSSLITKRKFSLIANDYRNLDWYTNVRKNSYHHCNSILAFSIAHDTYESEDEPIGFLTIDSKDYNFEETDVLNIAPVADLCYMVIGLFIDRKKEYMRCVRESQGNRVQ